MAEGGRPRVRLAGRGGPMGREPILSDDGQAVLRVLLRHPVGGCERPVLEAALGWSSDTLLDALAWLVDHEWCVVSGEGAAAVRALPWAALLFGRQPSQDASRWVAVKCGRRHAPLPRQLAPEDDRRREPDPATLYAADDDGLPWPTVLITGSQTVWTEHPHRPASPCPACGGAKLRRSEVCLRCLRYGLDHRIGAILRRQETPAQRAERRRRRAEKVGLKGGVG